ncbi:MAG: prolyl oligopeptidase family serine peptidase, partial [Armatimonadota bacterium]|nr:prolyl oligopeptidase family serine peptidase [Armatimonadota bacterium]
VSSLRQAVLDARRGLDYLARRSDVDPNRLGIAGISLGGILSGLTAGVDSRIKVAITVVGGADFAKGFWDGLATRHYRDEIKGSGYTYETYQAAMAPVDAGNWLPKRHFDPKNVLMINGRYDLVILPDGAKALAKDFGGTKIVWLNTGHYGAATAADAASKLGDQFLRARFFGETAGFHRPDGLPARTLKLGLLLGGHEGVSPVIATPLINFDGPGRYTIDGQVTLHGLSLAASARIGLISSVGVEFPLLHGRIKPRPFVMFSVTL